MTDMLAFGTASPHVDGRMKALSRQDFLTELRRIGAERYHDKHPFHERLHQGKLSRQELMIWVKNRYYYQSALPVKDAYIIAALPTRESRRIWLARIMDQDGCMGDEGGIEAWLRLGEALSVNRNVLQDTSTVLAGVRFAVDAYVNFCRLQSWYEAVAASLTELFAPQLIAQRMDRMREHYPWIEEEGFDYFKRRLTQAPRDVEHALELVLVNGTTPELQGKALAALEFKCDVLWAMLDAIESACGSPQSGI